VSAGRRKLIAAASALGLALSIATQAIGAPAHPAAEQRHGAAAPASKASGAQHRHADHRAKLALLDKPGDRFERAVAVARRRAAARREAARAEAGSAGSVQGSADGFPTPEAAGISSATLSAIASCESGGNPAAVSADGAYHGKYQFDYGTWASVGGSGDPAAAPEAEQDYRAAMLYARSGSSAWPNCG
jgi:hypothetical protein